MIPGITLAIYDESTRAPLDGATAEFRSGGFREVVESSASIDGKYLIAGAWERAGVYAITVTRPGYATWLHEGVEVAVEVCVPRTQVIEVELTPSN